MKFLRKREAENPEEEEQLTGRARGIGRFTIGAIVNIVISLDFVALVFASLVVIGTVGTVQHDLFGISVYYDPPNNRSAYVCYFYSLCFNETCTKITPGASHSCDASLAGFVFIIIMAVAFFISLVVKAILHHE